MTIGFGCVVLTAGRRPAELEEALRSLLDQRGVDVDVVVVGNGWRPAGLPAGVRSLHLSENRGIPAGRNAGVPETRGDLLFFLDDDARLGGPGVLARIAEEFAADPRLGLAQPRVLASDGGRPLAEWAPRLGRYGAERSGEVTVVWEGALAARRAAFEAAGGWPVEFHAVHEGVDLAWRVMDAGYRVGYLADVTALHPTPAPSAARGRHGYSHYLGARNRVWLARRHLPLPLGLLFVATFAARTAPRLRTASEARAALRGYRDGLRQPCGPRRPLRARTLWRMTRSGRPPVI